MMLNAPQKKLFALLCFRGPQELCKATTPKWERLFIIGADIRHGEGGRGGSGGRDVTSPALFNLKTLKNNIIFKKTNKNNKMKN